MCSVAGGIGKTLKKAKGRNKEARADEVFCSPTYAVYPLQLQPKLLDNDLSPGIPAGRSRTTDRGSGVGDEAASPALDEFLVQKPGDPDFDRAWPALTSREAAAGSARVAAPMCGAPSDSSAALGCGNAFGYHDSEKKHDARASVASNNPQQ